MINENIMERLDSNSQTVSGKAYFHLLSLWSQSIYNFLLL